MGPRAIQGLTITSKRRSTAANESVWGFGTSTSPIPWTEAFGSSRFIPKVGVLVFWGVLALIFVGHIIYGLYRHWDGGEWLYKLTHWSLTFETVYVVCHFILALLAFTAPDSPDDTETLSGEVPTSTGFSRFTMAIFMIQLPLSIAVVFMYYTLDKPIWNLCSVTGNAAGCLSNPDYLSVFVHGIDCLLILISFVLFSRVPYKWENSLWLVVFTVAYSVWTGIHSALGLGLSDGCSQYTDNSLCPIYGVVDWGANPELALIVVLGINLGAAPLVAFLSWGFGKLRDIGLEPETAPSSDSEWGKGSVYIALPGRVLFLYKHRFYGTIV